MGLITLSFPWLFSSSWPVLTLSIVSSLFITVLKTSSMKEWSSVICAKGRQSIGEICFPLAVGLTFLLADGNKILYVVPVLLLTLADAASAIVGQRFGKHPYNATDGVKTFEGSFAFAAVALLASYLSLHFMAGSPYLEALIISSILALLAMMFEGVGWKGLDNLFVPLGAFLVLKSHIGQPPSILLYRLGLLFVLFLIVYVARRNTTLNGSDIMGAALFCYFSFLLGGVVWMIMPAILYLSYRFLLPARFRNLKNAHSIYGVISVASIAIIWLLIANVSQSEAIIFPYALTFASHAAIISTAHMRFTNFSKAKVFALLYAVLKAWCLMCIPLIFISHTTHMIVLTLFPAPFAIGIPTVLFHVTNSHNDPPYTNPSRWWKQATFAALGSAIGLTAFLII